MAIIPFALAFFPLKGLLIQASIYIIVPMQDYAYGVAPVSSGSKSLDFINFHPTGDHASRPLPAVKMDEWVSYTG